MKIITTLAFLINLVNMYGQPFFYSLYSFEYQKVLTTKEQNCIDSEVFRQLIGQKKVADFETDIWVFKTENDTLTLNDFNEFYNKYIRDEYININFIGNIDSLHAHRSFSYVRPKLEVSVYRILNNKLHLNTYYKFEDYNLKLFRHSPDTSFLLVDSFKNGYHSGTSYHYYPSEKIIYECLYKDSFNFIKFEKRYFSNGEIYSYFNYDKLIFQEFSQKGILIKEKKIDIYGNILDEN